MGLLIKSLSKIKMTEDRRGDDNYHLSNSNGITHFDHPEGVYDAECPYEWKGHHSEFNNRREELCIMLHGITLKRYHESEDKYELCPFYYLLSHGDNCGDFGLWHCNTLARDFKMAEAKAMQHVSAFFIEWYRDMMVIFINAAMTGGAVHFT